MKGKSGEFAGGCSRLFSKGERQAIFTVHTYPQLLEEERKVGIAGVLSKTGTASSEVLHAPRSLSAA